MIYKQIYATIDVLCLIYANGFIFGMISVLLPSLRLPDSGIQLTADEESWIASLAGLLSFPAQCLGAFVSDRFGRRLVVRVSLLPPAFSFILMYCAHSASLLQAASTLSGLLNFGAGMGPILIAECTSPKYRGVLLSTKICVFILGACTVHFLGNFFYWRHLVLIGVAPCLLGLVTSLSSPESPSWLAARGRFRECERAFQWLRGAEDAAELRALVDSQRTAQRENKLKATSGAVQSTLQYLSDKCFLKAVFICLASTLVMETGVVFIMYIIDLITTITGEKENIYYIVVGLDIQSIINSFISIWCVKRFRARSLLFGTGVPAVCFLLLFSLVSYLISQSIIPSDFKWLQLAFLMLFFLMRDVGFPIALNLTGEVLPLSHRGVGVAASGLVFTIVSFAGIKLLPTLMAVYGVHGAFSVIAGVLIFGLTCLYNFMPETRDKTLLDIEYELGGKNLKVIALKEEAGLEEEKMCLDV